jgi:hypothetical protein
MSVKESGDGDKSSETPEAQALWGIIQKKIYQGKYEQSSSRATTFVLFMLTELGWCNSNIEYLDGFI